MNRIQKEEWVSELRSRLQHAALVVVTRPQGLTVDEVTQLRRQMKENGAEFKVVKNTLAELSVEGMPYEGLKSLFKGESALAYSNDPIAAARVAVKYSQTNNKLSVVGGYMDGRILDEASVKALATLPSLDELRSKLIALISAPATKIAILLKEPASRVARVLHAKASQS